MTAHAPFDVRISSLGGQGDGIANTSDGPLYVPLALPGELVRVQRGPKKGEGFAARVLETVEPSPERAAPACRHFGTCGGCALQHLSDAAYAGFKRDLVVHALERRGLGDVPVDAAYVVPPGTRRRTKLTAKRAGKRIVVGYAERSSHRIVDVMECPVLHPDLATAIQPLRNALPDVMKGLEALQLGLTLTDTGIDLLVTADTDLTLAVRERLVALAEESDLARVSWNAGDWDDPVVQRREPVIGFGPLKVALSPGAFLQASADAEVQMRNLATQALTGTERIADLFSGCGTFAGPLAAEAPVDAFDTDQSLVAALRAAAGAARLDGHLRADRRDLFREPLAPVELAAYDGVVIDPPRAGARAQSEALAQSAVPLIVAFSCNPSTFARDARALVDGGYRLEAVQPIDQFRWSAHVELAAVFRR